MATLALFRPEEKLPESLALAESLGFRVLAVPMLRARALPSPRYGAFLEQLAEGAVHWTVFTSSLGVRFAFELGRPVMDEATLRRHLAETRLVAVGPATAEALREAGLSVAIVPDTFSSEGIVTRLAQEDLAKATVALLRSDKGSAVLAEGLARRGALVLDVPVYALEAPEDEAAHRATLTRLAREGAEAFAFTSSETARNVLDRAAALGLEAGLRTALAQGVVGALGEPTRRTLEGMGVRVDVVPPEATVPSLLDALRAALKANL